MSNISLGEFADRIGRVMPVIAKGFTKQHMAEFYKLKITMPQMAILNLLQIQKESRMTDLARNVGVTTAAMTGVVDKLVRDGYVLRASDPKDRRIVRVRPTARGQRLVEKINDKRRQMIMHMFGKISQAERDEYLRILMHIKEHMEEER